VTASVAGRAAAHTRAKTRAWTIPWPLYSVVLASTCIVVGLIWDVSWHRTVGRDTFWTLAHVLEQVAAVIAGLSCGYLVLRTTFAGTPEEKGRSVRFWRFFYGPLGAWVCIWGTLMMITSAPLDNWWHNAYGLDVKIISPPHMVLAWGMIGIQIGAMLMTLSAQNRATPDDQKLYSMMHAYAAGILITMIATVIQEDASVGNQMHGSKFLRDNCVDNPPFSCRPLSGVATQVAGHYHHRHFFRDHPGNELDPSALSGDAEAGADLQPGHAHGAAGLSAAHHRAGDCG